MLSARHAGEFAKVKAANEFKIVAVASRKILCVNSKVKALGSSWRINDECLQLQSKTTSKKQTLSGTLQNMVLRYRLPNLCWSDWMAALAYLRCLDHWYAMAAAFACCTANVTVVCSWHGQSIRRLRLSMQRGAIHGHLCVKRPRQGDGHRGPRDNGHPARRVPVLRCTQRSSICGLRGCPIQLFDTQVRRLWSSRASLDSHRGRMSQPTHPFSRTARSFTPFSLHSRALHTCRMIVVTNAACARCMCALW